MWLLTLIGAAPLEKSLQIVLVRDVDGKTFWDALDDAISPRIKSLTPVDQSALSTFRNIFQGRSLKKGTFIFLTWLDSSKMLVSVKYATIYCIDNLILVYTCTLYRIEATLYSFLFFWHCSCMLMHEGYMALFSSFPHDNSGNWNLMSGFCFI